MRSPKKHIIMILVLFFSTGCTGIVKKPEVFRLKKVAIVSIQTNQGIYNISEASSGGFFSFSQFSNKPPTDLDGAKIPAPGGFRLVDFGLNTFEEEMAKIKGWQVVPAIKIVNSLAYQKFSKTVFAVPERSIASQALARWFAPQGMYPAGDVNSALKRKETITQIQNFVQQAGLDGVVFVSLDLAYAPDQNGAYASVASSIKVVAKDGSIVVSTPDVVKGAGDRHSSDVSSPLLGDQLVYNDQVETMYKVAIQKSATSLREKINKEL